MGVIPPIDLAAPQPVEIVISRKLLTVRVDQVAEKLIVPKSSGANVRDPCLLGEAGFTDFGRHEAFLRGAQLGAECSQAVLER